MMWPTLREASAFGLLVTSLMERGWPACTAASTAWRQVYTCSLSDSTSSPYTSGDTVHAIVSGWACSDDTLLRPLMWPAPLGVAELAGASPSLLMRREAAILVSALAAAVATGCVRTGDGAAGAVPPWLHRSSAAAPYVSVAALRSFLSKQLAPEPVKSCADAHHVNGLMRGALSLFMDAATPFDAATRAQFLRELDLRMSPPSDALQLQAPVSLLTSCASAAGELSRHPVLDLLHAVRVRAAEARCCADVVSAFPSDKDAGVTAAEELAALRCLDAPQHADASDESEVAATAQALCACEALMSATRVALQAAAEIAVLSAAASDIAASPTSSHLTVCLQRAASPADRIRRAAAHPALDALPLVLAAAASVEMTVISASIVAMQGALETQKPSQLLYAARIVAERAAQLRRVAEWRVRVIELLSVPAISTPPPVEALLMAWLCLRKPLVRLCALLQACDAHAPAAASAAVAASEMDACWGISAAGAPKPLLWRAGGHPSLPSSVDVCGMELELRGLCEVSELAHDAALRAGLADAVCFFSWTHVGAATNMRVLPGNDAAELLSLSRAKVQALRSELDRNGADTGSIQADADAASETCDGPDANARGTTLTFPRRASVSHVGSACAAALRSVHTLANLRCSVPLLTALTGACSSQSAMDIAVHLRGSDAVTLLQHGLAATDRSPLDLAPLKQTNWLAERALDDPAALEQLMAALPSVAHELWFRFHSSLWAQQFELERAPPWSVASGPMQLFRPSLAARLAASAERAAEASVSERPAVLLQLRLTTRSLRHGETCGALPDAALLPSAGAADALACRTLAAQLLRAYQSAAPVLARVAALLSSDTHEGTVTALDELRVACEHDASSTASRIFLPLLVALASATADRPAGSAADEAARGESWAHLGAARLALLSAELLADPAARDAFKLKHVQSLCRDEAEPEVLLRSAAAALPGAHQGLRARARADASVETLRARASRLASRVVPRPLPSVWGAARAEIDRFASGLGCVRASDDLRSDQSQRQDDKFWSRIPS